MTTPEGIPALARPAQTLVRAGVFSTHREAEKQIRRGNIYIEINPDTPTSSYWLRLDDTNALLCIPNQTRVKYIDADGDTTYFDIRPYEGNTVRG